MTTISEVAPMKIYTETRFLCPVCNRNSNFMYVVKQVESIYYLLEMCPKCGKHVEDIREIPSRMVKDYPQPQK
jgi:transcription elongation factor Elf1